MDLPWFPATSTAPAGPAGGDLAGNYPNPTIKDSVALAGNPTAATQAANNNSTRLATTAYVDNAVAGFSLASAAVIAPAASTRNVIQPTGAAIKPLIVKGAASQSANLFEAQDSSGNLLFTIAPSGATTISASAGLNVNAGSVDGTPYLKGTRFGADRFQIRGHPSDSNTTQMGHNSNPTTIVLGAGGLAFFGGGVVGQQAVGAAAVDAATTQTLANNLRTALINLGLCTT